MILKKLNFIVFFCFLLFRFPVYSKVKISDSDTIRLNKNFHFIDLKTETYYFSEKDMPLEKVLLKNFKPRDSLYFSYATGWIWVKFIIKNESLKNTFILSATASQIAGYYLYKPESNGYVLTPPKINHPEDGREINSNIPSFYISLKKGEVKTFFMKVRVEEEVFRCNYIIRDITHFIEFSQINYSILGIYIGVLLIIITINIFYSIALKDSLFFIYATYIIGVLMATLAFEGFIWMLTPNTILGYHICYFILRFWTDSLLFFTIKLSDVKKYRPKLYKTICVYLIYHEVIMAVLQLTDFFNFRLVLAGKWEMVNCMITMLLVFIAIISSYKNTNYLFKYYIIGFGAVLLSSVVFPLYTFGYIENYLLTESSIKAGTLIEMITLSFAVSRRFRLTENDLKIKKEEEKQFNEKIKELETNIRKAQMNPHFMFNALTSIEYYILKNNPKEACIYLEEFAQLMRLTLDNSRESYIPLEDELKALKLYIGLEFLRLKEKGHELTFRIDESIDQESIVVPALLIQPFVENAILHGLQKKTESGRLTIDVAFDGNNLQCLIEDNGGGIIKRNQTVKRKSSGIQITKERLTLIHGMLNTTYRFEINDLLDGFHNVIGTRVLFYIPYKKD